MSSCTEWRSIILSEFECKSRVKNSQITHSPHSLQPTMTAETHQHIPFQCIVLLVGISILIFNMDIVALTIEEVNMQCPILETDGGAINLTTLSNEHV
mmetsp:Transcript_4752/g.17818  ORF Transcript_4752/g.17818 Transcript_4752/m.17818 type:complete len:98 (+) Transcript_4752:1433-1726(+)